MKPFNLSEEELNKILDERAEESKKLGKIVYSITDHCLKKFLEGKDSHLECLNSLARHKEIQSEIVRLLFTPDSHKKAHELRRRCIQLKHNFHNIVSYSL